MKKLGLCLVLVGVMALSYFIISYQSQPPHAVRCSDSLMQEIHQSVRTGDDQGHGPDVGSSEWQSVVEFKLGLRGSEDVPNKGTDQWCQFMLQHIQASEPNAEPSFSCKKKNLSSIEQLICQDAQLVAFDHSLATVFSQVLQQVSGDDAKRLKALQRGWIKGRNDCWKAQNQRQCVESAYEQRIAELQATYKQVDAIGPITFICDDNSSHKLSVTFFATEPQSLMARYQNQTSFMMQAVSASGSRYEGQNQTFWEHQGQAILTWGFGQDPKTCNKVIN